MTAVLEILQAGPHVTYQDAGRPGLMRYGVPASGPMDRKALAIANTALGNPIDKTGVEISLGGLTLLCHQTPVTVAIAGGGFIVTLNDTRLGAWTVLTLHPQDRLTIRPGQWGSWCYLAFAGQIQSLTWLKSASTHAASGLGGGRLLAGDQITIDQPRTAPSRAIPCPVWARARHQINLTLGPQQALFRPETIQTLLSATYRMTGAFDRMGMRLSGPALMPENALGIPSQAVTRGAVQVAGDGVPTVLLADHQTTGGYPKIATILDDDTDALAQLRPGDPMAFTAISPARAILLARQRNTGFQRYLATLSKGPS